MLSKICEAFASSKQRTMIKFVISSTIAMVSAQQSEETNSKDTVENGASSDTDDKDLL